MKIYCIKYGLKNITYCKIYDVIDYENNKYLIITDLGDDKWYNGNNFKVILNKYVKYIGYNKYYVKYGNSYQLIGYETKNNLFYSIIDDSGNYDFVYKSDCINIQEERSEKLIKLEI